MARPSAAPEALTVSIVSSDVEKYAKDNRGSIFLRTVLHQTQRFSNDDRQTVATALIPAVVDLSFDSYGSQVIQSLIEHSSLRDAAAYQLKGHLAELAKNEYGCRVVQKVQIFVKGRFQNDLDAEISESLMELSLDMHGNDIVIRSIENGAPEFLLASIGFFCEQVLVLAQDQIGYRIIQRLLSRCNALRLSQHFEPVLQQIISCALELSQHKFGNYVVQSLLEEADFEYQLPVVSVVRENLASLSKQKDSSMVVEKCITCMTCDTENTSRLKEFGLFNRAILDLAPELIRNRFGYSIIQHLAKCCSSEHQAFLFRDSLTGLLNGMGDAMLQERISKAILLNDSKSIFSEHAAVLQGSAQTRCHENDTGKRLSDEIAERCNGMKGGIDGKGGKKGTVEGNSTQSQQGILECREAVSDRMPRPLKIRHRKDREIAQVKAKGSITKMMLKSATKKEGGRKPLKPHKLGVATKRSVPRKIDIQNIGTQFKNKGFSESLLHILRRGTDADKNTIFNTLLPEILRASLDEFGNYVVQLLVEQASEEQLRSLADSLLDSVKELALDRYGTHVLQKMQSVMRGDFQTRLEMALGDVFFDIIQHVQGNRILVSAIQNASAEFFTFVVNALTERTDTLAQPVFMLTIRVALLPRCVDPEIADIADPLLQKLCDMAVDLASNDYGNYVVQSMLEHGRPEDQSRIVAAILENIVSWSTAKIPSNVVSKCFSVMGEDKTNSRRQEHFRALAQAILGEDSAEDAPLQLLVLNRYGCQVLQALVEHVSCDDEELVKRRLSDVLPQLHKQMGHCLLGAILKRFPNDPAFASIKINAVEDATLEKPPGNFDEDAASASSDLQLKNFKTAMCKQFLKGACSRGLKCTFAHSEAEIQCAKTIHANMPKYWSRTEFEQFFSRLQKNATTNRLPPPRHVAQPSPLASLPTPPLAPRFRPAPPQVPPPLHLVQGTFSFPPPAPPTSSPSGFVVPPLPSSRVVHSPFHDHREVRSPSRSPSPKSLPHSSSPKERSSHSHSATEVLHPPLYVDFTRRFIRSRSPHRVPCPSSSSPRLSSTKELAPPSRSLTEELQPPLYADLSRRSARSRSPLRVPRSSSKPLPCSSTKEPSPPPCSPPKELQPRLAVDLQRRVSILSRARERIGRRRSPHRVPGPSPKSTLQSSQKALQRSSSKVQQPLAHEEMPVARSRSRQEKDAQREHQESKSSRSCTSGALSLEEVLLDVIRYATLPIGKKCLQSALSKSTADSFVRDTITTALLPSVVHLSCDEIGHQVIQTLVEKCDSNQRQSISNLLVKNFAKLAKNKHGCLVVLKTFLFQKGDHRTRLEHEILQHMRDLSWLMSPLGFNLVLPILRLAEPPFLANAIEILADRTLDLAEDFYGSRIIQQMITRSVDLAMLEEFQVMLKHISEAALELALHERGSCVIQAILESVDLEVQQPIVDVLRMNIVHLAQENASSKVVKTCISVLASDENDTLQLYEGSLFTRAILDFAPELFRSEIGSDILLHLCSTCVGEDRDVVRRSLRSIRERKTGVHDVHLEQLLFKAVDGPRRKWCKSDDFQSKLIKEWSKGYLSQLTCPPNQPSTPYIKRRASQPSKTAPSMDPHSEEKDDASNAYVRRDATKTLGREKPRKGRKDATVTITFEPGPVGASVENGTIIKVHEGSQAQQKGVKAGWRVSAVGDQKCKSFEDKVFQDAKSAGKSYQVTFVQTSEARQECLQPHQYQRDLRGSVEGRRDDALEADACEDEQEEDDGAWEADDVWEDAEESPQDADSFD